MRRPLLALAATLTLVSGCGAQSAQKPAVSASAVIPKVEPSATPAQPPAPAGGEMFAVLENRKGDYPHRNFDRIAITGMDGHAVAAADFEPAMTSVSVCMAGAVLPPVPAYVVGGRAYFLDGTGAVRWLDAAGREGTVARFHLGPSQQMLSFAVSEDGAQVVASRMTLPSVMPGSGQQPCSSSGFPTLELLRAGGAGEQVVWSKPISDSGTPSIELVGWDSQGPLAVVGNSLATQNATLQSERIYWGHLARLDAGLQPGASLTPGDCLPYGTDFSRPFTCVSTRAGAEATVTDLTGRVFMKAKAAGQLPGDYVPAHDGSRLAMNGAVISAAGAMTSLPVDFHPQGWLGGGTLIGRLGDPFNGNGHLAVVDLASPSTPQDLGFSGDFVGSL